MRPCYHGNSSKPKSRGGDEKSRRPQKRQSSVCQPPFYPRRKAFPLEHAWEWVVGSEPTGSEGLRGVKWYGHWLFTGAQECGLLGVGRAGRRPSAQQGELGECKCAREAADLERWALQDPGFWDPARRVRSCLTPSKGILLCLWPLGSPGTPRGLPRSALGSCSAGWQLCMGSCPSCSLFRKHVKSSLCSPASNSLHSHRWPQFSVFGSSSLPWVKVFWRNQIVYDFTLNHDISQALESKAFLFVFMAGIRDNTALVKGKTFSKYFPPLKVFFFFCNHSKITQ